MRQRKKAAEKAERRVRYYRSGVFKRLFLSYTLIILLVFGAFIGWNAATYRREAAELARRKMEQKAVSFGTWMDERLLQARMLCASVNASENARSALQTVYVEKSTLDTLQLYNLLGELNRIYASARNAGLYSLILAFQGEGKVFLPGSVYSVEGECQTLKNSPYLGVNTAASLLGVSGVPLVLNKEYLIYGESYTGFGSGSSTKGVVLAMMDLDQLKSALRDRAGEQVGVRVARRGQTAFETGESEGYAIRVQSFADNMVEYTLFVPEVLLRTQLPVSAMIPLALMALASVFSVLLTYRIAVRYYRPIDSIHRLVRSPEGAEQDAGGNEFDRILEGITGLIGERNGYREKMVTITPYARQGILQAAIRGAGRPETLVEEQFTELKRNYYMVGEVNIAITRESAAAERRYQDLQALLLSVCRGWEDEKFQVVAVPENLQDTFVIAAGDDGDGFEDFFYRLFNALEETVGDERTVITIGTGNRESDLDRLSEACLEARNSLARMLTGGRGAVYFPEERAEADPGYWFPKDAQKQMTRMLREGNLEGLNGLLDELYRKNLVEADLPPAEVRQLTDELYWTIRKALRDAFDLSTTHVRMKPIRGAATVEEIFAYYRQVFETSLSEADPGAGGEKERNLEEEVCAWLEAHIYDPELSLNGVADRFGVSTKMVGLICRKKYNQTFLTYVRDRQIRHATDLLRETDLSLEEIANQCGFTNLLTFRRNFKAVTGVNPSEYRG